MYEANGVQLHALNMILLHDKKKMLLKLCRLLLPERIYIDFVILHAIETLDIRWIKTLEEMELLEKLGKDNFGGIRSYAIAWSIMDTYKIATFKEWIKNISSCSRDKFEFCEFIILYVFSHIKTTKAWCASNIYEFFRLIISAKLLNKYHAKIYDLPLWCVRLLVVTAWDRGDVELLNILYDLDYVSKENLPSLFVELLRNRKFSRFYHFALSKNANFAKNQRYQYICTRLYSERIIPFAIRTELIFVFYDYVKPKLTKDMQIIHEDYVVPLICQSYRMYLPVFLQLYKYFSELPDDCIMTIFSFCSSILHDNKPFINFKKRKIEDKKPTKTKRLKRSRDS